MLEMPEITNRNHEKTITFTRRVEPEKNPSCLHVESQQMCCNLVQTETDCIYQFSNFFEISCRGKSNSCIFLLKVIYAFKLAKWSNYKC